MAAICSSLTHSLRYALHFSSIEPSTQRTMDTQPADPCYITRLSQAVLLQIFNTATEHWDGVNDSRKAFPSPDRIVLTCKSWRAIMLSQGTPWSVLNLDKEVLTKHRYERSGRALLKVYWTHHTPRVDAFISQNLHRICLLDGFVEIDANLGTPTWLFDGDGRSLQSIDLKPSTICDEPDMRGLRFFSSGIPQRLYTLCLHTICPDLAGIGLSSGGLTELTLTSTYAAGTIAEMQVLLAMLKASPFLQKLRLSSNWFHIRSPKLDAFLSSVEAIDLPHLRDFWLDHPSANIFLKFFRLPDTAKCVVSAYSPVPPLMPVMNPIDLLGPEYLPAAYFSALSELTIHSTTPDYMDDLDHSVYLSKEHFTYTKNCTKPSAMRSLVIAAQTGAVTEDLITMMEKYPLLDVTRLRIDWQTYMPAFYEAPNEKIDLVAILPHLPAVTSLEYSMFYRDHIRHDIQLLAPAPTTTDLPSLSTPSTALPVIRKVVFRILQERLSWYYSQPVLEETVWCPEVLEPIAKFTQQFPAMERLTLVSYNPDDGPGIQAWVKTELERFGVDPQVSVRVERLEDPYHDKRKDTR